MTVKTEPKPQVIISWYTHHAGYVVIVTDEHGNVIEEYNAGNSKQDSYSFEPDPAYALTSTELEDYAQRTANEMAEELLTQGEVSVL